ncbi:MAG TPA: response regulator transcription factor [Halanaerobiales bacterium]|nr:response regulator transcription factor [Halanaerobiales bacterium]
MSEEKVLIVDDEKEIRELIRDYLEVEGFQVKMAEDGEQALNFFDSFKPDIIVLDIMLPKVDGMEICKIIRGKSNIPILMLSAKKSDVDKVLGLGLGADDYMTKPFSPKELVARIKAQLRRYNQLSKSNFKNNSLEFKDLKIDLDGYNVYLEGEKVQFSAKEFEILKFLALNPERVYSREQIFDQIWGFNEFGDINTVTVHIRKIREKIEEDSSNPQYIETVWGVGYKFVGDQDGMV